MARRHAPWLCWAAFSLMVNACAPAVTPPPVVPAVPTRPSALPANVVSDDQFGDALFSLVSDGGQSAAREALLAGAVKYQLTHAAAVFDRGQRDRGLATVTGAMWLVRAGELRDDMFDSINSRALDAAVQVVAPRGDEGLSLAFYRMLLTAGGPAAAQQADINQHIGAIETWMRDTRHGTYVENAGADVNAFGDLSMLMPSEQTLSIAEKVTHAWFEAGIEYSSVQQPEGDNFRREQAIEAYRAVKAGPFVLAALYLRHGDARGAVKALVAADVSRATRAEFIGLMRAAAETNEPMPWRELAGLFQNPKTQSFVTEPICQGAVWGSLVEAFRRAPDDFQIAAPLALRAIELGMPDLVSPLLRATSSRIRDNDAMTVALRLVHAAVVSQERASDPQAVLRIIRQNEPILAAAGSRPKTELITPLPAQIRLAAADLLMREAELSPARELVERVLKDQNLPEAYWMEASMLHQSGDDAKAIEMLERIKTLDAGADSSMRAQADLLAVQIHQDQGAIDQARTSLTSALHFAKIAVAKADNPRAKLKASWLISQIAYLYGDRNAVWRALSVASDAAGADKEMAGDVFIHSASLAFLLHDLPALRNTVVRALDSDLDDEDLVYLTLWLQAAAPVRSDVVADDTQELVRKAFARIHKNRSWVASLAAWGTAAISDQELQKAARTEPEKTEAAFYCALRARRNSASGWETALQQVAHSKALALVETALARELTLPAPVRAMGNPPSALP